MKTIEYNKKFMSKPLTSVHRFLAVALVLLIGATAIANGKGYSGADFATESIPLEYDKALLVEDVEKAENKCQVKYFAPLFKQMCEKLVENTPNSIIDVQNSKFLGPRTTDLVCYTSFPHQLIKFSWRFDTNTSDERLQVRMNSLYQSLLIKADMSFISISDSDLIKNGSYDDFGRYIPKKNKVKKVTLIRHPNNYFINDDTKKPTSFLLQSDRIAECIQTELQKLTETTEN